MHARGEWTDAPRRGGRSGLRGSPRRSARRRGLSTRSSPEATAHDPCSAGPLAAAGGPARASDGPGRGLRSKTCPQADGSTRGKQYREATRESSQIIHRLVHRRDGAGSTTQRPRWASAAASARGTLGSDAPAPASSPKVIYRGAANSIGYHFLPKGDEESGRSAALRMPAKVSAHLPALRRDRGSRRLRYAPPDPRAGFVPPDDRASAGWSVRHAPPPRLSRGRGDTGAGRSHLPTWLARQMPFAPDLTRIRARHRKRGSETRSFRRFSTLRRPAIGA